MIVLATDEATAKAGIAEDPATQAGLLKSAFHPFNLLMPPAPPPLLVSDTRVNYDAVAKFAREAAQKMLEEHYAFRPMPDVRTFGQLVALHHGDAVSGLQHGPRGALPGRTSTSNRHSPGRPISSPRWKPT